MSEARVSVKSTVGMHACLLLPPPAVLDAGADANLLVEGGGSDAPRSAAALAAKAGYGRSLAVLLPRSKPSIVQDVVVRAARTAAEAGGSPASVVRHPLLAVALGCPATTPAVVQVSLLPPHRTPAVVQVSRCSSPPPHRGVPVEARHTLQSVYLPVPAWDPGLCSVQPPLGCTTGSRVSPRGRA